MTPEDAAAYSRDVYQFPEALPLLLAAFDPERSASDRERALAALHAIDIPGASRWLAFDPPRVPRVLAGAALSVAELVLYMFDASSRLERERVAGLLVALCREAAAIDRSRRERRAS